MIKIEVLSHYLFEDRCKEDGLNDSNVEDKNWSFIDIIGTEECLKYYLNEDTKHYFNDSHENVLNLEFDDTSEDIVLNGHLFKTFRIEQAEKAVDFIEREVEKGTEYFRICCRAGMSRSRAFGEFIYRYCKDNNIDVDYKDRRDYTTLLNQGVLRMLNHAYWKKHKMRGYEEDGAEYPSDIVKPPIVYVNDNEV